VPIQPGDKITMLGYNGGPLQWSQQNGQLIINVPTAAQQAGQHAWVFKIAWH
jgi:alpha-L-fucosidase